MEKGRSILAKLCILENLSSSLGFVFCFCKSRSLNSDSQQLGMKFIHSHPCGTNAFFGAVVDSKVFRNCLNKKLIEKVTSVCQLTKGAGTFVTSRHLISESESTRAILALPWNRFLSGVQSRDTTEMVRGRAARLPKGAQGSFMPSSLERWKIPFP